MRTVMRQEQLWAIVLAGGEGGAMGPLVQQWLGCLKPNQYCAFVGTRSLFQHTLDRAAHLVLPEHTVTVIAREHQEEACTQFDGRAGIVILQPANCGTAAEVFLPLTYIRARDPQATVVLYPSDQFVYPEDRFVENVQRAVWTAEWLTDRLALLGVRPDRLDLDYGWIQPGRALAGSDRPYVWEINAFVEKPSAAQAAMISGALWNTLVLAVKLETLWKLGWRCFPEMMGLFDRLGDQIGTAAEGRVLEEIYRTMPKRDFSAGLLQRVPDQSAVLELSGVLWSGWGKPDRVADTLRQIGKQPAFPMEYMTHGGLMPTTYSATASVETASCDVQ
ncbi:MAG: hypothetical protein E6K69_07255 [Nitrospirae bacterium]|nr:MAG: hypothetical protein E6K69_07255 [Nitrospirota bacterium]